MAFINNKDLASLQAENRKLTIEIVRLNLRISEKDRKIVEMQEQIQHLEREIKAFGVERKGYEDTIAGCISFPEVDKMAQGFEAEILELQEQLAALPIRQHNERSAGRKRKATPEQIKYILSLHADGFSHSKIAEMLTARTGAKWNKSTIRNVILAAKN